MPRRPVDARSTQRKRARKVLEDSGRAYACECRGVPGCEHETPCGYSPSRQSRSDTLDANHVNKNLFDLRPSNLEWLCRGCHKRKDSQTERGTSVLADEFGMSGLLRQIEMVRGEPTATEKVERKSVDFPELEELNGETLLHVQDEGQGRKGTPFPTLE
jgi:hypothetical protein